MKTVIVFDTEDLKGMQATFKIVDHLSQEYLGMHLRRNNDVSFGKIQFIKKLREYGRLIEEGKSSTGLKDTKTFADHVFIEEKRKSPW